MNLDINDTDDNQSKNSNHGSDDDEVSFNRLQRRGHKSHAPYKKQTPVEKT